MSPLVTMGAVHKVVLHWAPLELLVLSRNTTKSDSKLRNPNSVVWDIVWDFHPHGWHCIEFGPKQKDMDKHDKQPHSLTYLLPPPPPCFASSTEIH